MALFGREKPIVKTCCCGCSLYTGTLIIMVWDLITAILNILSSLIPVGNDRKRGTLDSEIFMPCFVHTQVLFVLPIVYYTVVVILASLGIHGTRKGRRKLLIPWLVGLPLRQLFNIVLAIVIFTKGSPEDTPGNQNSNFQIIAQAVIMILSALLLIYMFLVVYSFYIELTHGESRNRQHAVT